MVLNCTPPKMTSSIFMNDIVNSYVLERQVANTDSITLRATDVPPVSFPDLRMSVQFANNDFTFNTPYSLRHYQPSAPLMQRHVANTDAIQPLATDIQPLNLEHVFNDSFLNEDSASFSDVTLVNGVYRHDPHHYMDLMERYAPALIPTEEFWSDMEEAVAYCIVQPTDSIGTTYLIDDIEEIGIQEDGNLRLQCVLRLVERINDEICIWTRHIYIGYQWSHSFQYDVEAIPNRR